MNADQYFNSLDVAAMDIHNATYWKTGQKPEWDSPIRLCRKCLNPFSSSPVKWRARMTPCPYCHKPFPNHRP